MAMDITDIYARIAKAKKRAKGAKSAAQIAAAKRQGQARDAKILTEEEKGGAGKAGKGTKKPTKAERAAKAQDNLKSALTEAGKVKGRIENERKRKLAETRRNYRGKPDLTQRTAAAHNAEAAFRDEATAARAKLATSLSAFSRDSVAKLAPGARIPAKATKNEVVDIVARRLWADDSMTPPRVKRTRTPA